MAGSRLRSGKTLGAHLEGPALAALDASDQAVAIFRPGSSAILYANAEFARLLGTTREELQGRNFFLCLGDKTAQRFKEAVVSLAESSPAALRFETDLELPLRPAHRVQVSLARIHPTPRRPLIAVYLLDITDRAKTKSTLRDRIHFLERVIGGTLQSIIVTDMQGKILMFNVGSQALLGWTEAEVIGRKYVQDFYEGNAGSEIMTLMRSPDHGSPGAVSGYQAILIAKDRERIPVWLTAHILQDAQGRDAATVTSAHDMRETVEMERRLEEVQMQLIHADKMASLGKLAAGVAHEINNPLGGILLFGGLLLEDMDFADPRREDMDRIVQEARRCRDIVNSLLDFAHQRKRYQEPVDLNAAVDQCLSLLGNKALFHNIRIVKELDEVLPLVTGNPSQIKQVFTNIVSNAVDAMGGEGVLTISSGFARDRQEVQVAFTDTGPGIPANVQTRIFDPFFTTKEPGKGTGLGLSLCYNIMRMHRGDIRVHCAPGGGTTFTVALPVAEEDEQ